MPEVMVQIYDQEGHADIIMMNEDEAHEKYSEIYDTMSEILPVEKQGKNGLKKCTKFLNDIVIGCEEAGNMACHGVIINTSTAGMIPYGTELFLGVIFGCAASNEIAIAD